VALERTTFARRRLLHGLAADALARRHERDSSASVSAAVVAHDFEQSGRGTEAAAWWWRAAARSRALYAHEQAYPDLARALALGYSPADVWAVTGDVLVALGRYTEAIGAYEVPLVWRPTRPSLPVLNTTSRKLLDCSRQSTPEANPELRSGRWSSGDHRA
jgi:tetratricopeptide (TPR) repeat protein